MKYFLIAGEASGDLHGSRLIEAIAQHDHQAQFRFLGGDLMQQAAQVAPIIHYRDMAYMGFVEVAKHLPTILGFLRTARQAIDDWHPDHVVLIDYPSFNLKVARHAHERGIGVHYFISPKVWVWKEWRVRDIKRYVHRMYCILPFEPDWYAQRGYQATYVGNPTMQEIAEALPQLPGREQFCHEHGLDPSRPIIALVPGSRVKEIRDNLPSMLEAARRHPDCQTAIAAAPNIDLDLYASLAQGVPLLTDATWSLVRHARVAIVTSGTATLETAMLGTPQVACYRMTGKKWLYRFYRRLLKGNYVTLPNLIADEPVIPELLMHLCTSQSIDSHITELLAESATRQAQLDGYRRVLSRLGTNDCADTAARLITKQGVQPAVRSDL
ncbi:MAG: lipid-A-disaccharide synthase [Muribaculaceae bacterium]|nr:lipid-A-disaccharide synthase [Muribaculaceae bacterium]